MLIKKHIYIIVLLMTSLISCSKKKQEIKQWYKGNLHAHSYWSDGEEFPEMVMDWYKTNAYDFTVLSDHNILAKGDKWITVSKREYLQKGFQNYLKRYGKEWVNYRIDSLGEIQVKLKTFEEYKPMFEENGKFLIIQSEEISAKYENIPIHMNATNIQEFIEPRKGESVVEVVQNNIDAILEQREKTKTPILPHINHPNYHNAISVNDFMQLKNIRFFEVFNGHPSSNDDGDSTHVNTEKMWDLINISYLEQNKPLMYAVAADDSHQYNKFTKHTSNPGRGWVMVNAISLDANNIINAMEQGDFYASTGIVLKEVSFYKNNLKIEIDVLPDVEYEIQFIGANKENKEIKILDSQKGSKAEFKVTNEYLFVRAKITSNKTNQNFFNEEFEQAWTQPIKYQSEY